MIVDGVLENVFPFGDWGFAGYRMIGRDVSYGVSFVPGKVHRIRKKDGLAFTDRERLSLVDFRRIR